jgi:hypothetical protein
MLVQGLRWRIHIAWLSEFYATRYYRGNLNGGGSCS